jgi:hypothetical protein
MAEKVNLEFDDEYEWIDDGRAKSVETYSVVADIGTFCKTFVIAKSQASTDQAKLADTGANCSMTADLALLENVTKLSEPIIIGTAVTDTSNISTTSECTLIGDLPIQCDDGSRIYTRCFYNPNASDTIISPQSIIESSDTFKEWQQVGRRMGKPGILKFLGNGQEKCITLHQKNGLYYCNAKTFDITDSKHDSNTINKSELQANKAKCPSCLHPTAPAKSKHSVPKSTKYKPTSKAKILEAETWYLR